MLKPSCPGRPLGAVEDKGHQGLPEKSGIGERERRAGEGVPFGLGGSLKRPVFPENPSLQLLHGRPSLVGVGLQSRVVFAHKFPADLEPQRGAILLFQDPFHEELFEAVAESELRLAEALTEDVVVEPLEYVEVGDSGGPPSSAQCAYALELPEEAVFPPTRREVSWFLARARGRFTAL